MNKGEKTISILGCGWLGLPLAERLLEKGFLVKGSSTSTEKLQGLSEKGIQPFHIHLSPQINADYQPEFFESQVLILNIPPGRRQPDIETIYPQQISELIKVAGETSLKKILFVGSTSVYPNLNREVTEEDAGGQISSSGKAILKAEQILHNQNRFQISILRFCGLYNRERNPGRFLAGKELSSSGKDRVNLIHQEDCIRIIMKLIEKESWGETFNACGDQHPEKEQFYPVAAKHLGLTPPSFDDKASASYKIINSGKLKQKLDYSFAYPDPAKALEKS
ncbi:nucleoside-diphosphate-sugar epimerase [Catalinimonas alkaloidigena]|uniref:SDR family oxidoreductase n=1 Tax=Catalinimonas alkaloidigena TaxID=1075417 RepID=UPI002407122E|nr:SDR family oxidoreductase [Catalinimonas alkaloidigena]MDF9796195.1 nucleoside-diphosphate-sugar epimerase [Catalinimonas alkaloidigena]